MEKALIAAENGVDIGRYFLVREEHDRIDDEDISAQAKATRFAHYLDGLALTAQQKTVLQGLLTYSGGFTAEASEKALDAIDAGMSLEDYEKYHEAVSGMSADYDDSGKAISGSKKAKVIEYIEGLNVSAEVKDLLYTQQGYAASGLDETPWHQ